MDNIIENNKLIAKFMYNNLYNEDSLGDCWVETNEGYVNFYIDKAKYHLSWDWLMPVVEKIEHLYETEHTLPRFEINSHICSFAVGYPEFKKYKRWIYGCYINSAESKKCNSKLEAAYNVCIDFIKWYNK